MGIVRVTDIDHEKGECHGGTLRRSIIYILLFFVSIVSPHVVMAQDYPTKPVTLLVPFGPGGDSDLSGRVLSSVAVDYLGQPLIIQLKPGDRELSAPTR